MTREMSDSQNRHTVLRIIDANLNRAREALRVMEEYARLGLNDAGLSSAIKETRHALGEAVVRFEQVEAQAGGRTPGQSRGLLARGSMLAGRDITGDVGCEVGTPAEYERADAWHVALAAGKRLSEALRAVEEYGKTADPLFAGAIEKIRYRGYELERRLYATATARERFGHVRLYVIITESMCSGDWLATAEAALSGGADCLQLREKELSDDELLKRSRRLAKLCHDYDALFIVNDRPDVAVVSDADGVHLGRDDLPVAAARRIVPLRCIVGVSTHSMAQVEAAAAAAPDYVAVGPMFATPTKPRERIAGPKMLAAARECTSLPLVAIGGIDEGNIEQVLSTAACTVCVCRAVVAQGDASAAASRLRSVIDRTTSK